MKRLLNANEAAQYLSISVRTVEYLRLSASLPYHVFEGWQILFDPDELKNWALERDHDSYHYKRKEAPME